MKEEVVTFGKDGFMVGIMHEPTKHSEEKPMIVILNSGVVHRVGPFRGWVDFARQLCAEGFCVFRFDMTGIGDSPKRKDRRSENELAILDIREAIDYLEQSRGVKRIVFIGLCSGFDLGYPVTVDDTRVVGSVFMDGMGYRTWAWYFHHYIPRFIDSYRWMYRFVPLILGFWKNVFAKLGIVKKLENVKQFERTFPERQTAQAQLTELVARGVDLLFIYSGSASRYYNYAGQFRAMFPTLDWKDKIEVEYFSKFDHTYSLREHRAVLHERIRKWLHRY